jgi:hypothetical protein
MPDLLTLGLRRASMIILRLDGCARLVRRPHVVQIIRAAEFKSANVLYNPALAHAINLALTQYADAPVFSQT